MNFAPAQPATLEDAPTPVFERALISAFLENIPDYVYFKDRESRFIALSASLVRYFGVSHPNQVIGRTDFDFFDEKHARPAFDDEQKIMRTGEPIIGKLEREVWPDGRVTFVTTSKLPLRDERGQIIGTFGLSKDVTESKRMELALEKAHKDLVHASHMAGMAEVATGVLHNVGNVLNSLNVAASVISTGLRQSKADSLGKISAMLREHSADLGNFLTADPRGRLVPDFIESLARHTTEERARLLQEVESLQKNIDHIKEIVSMQQAYATMISVVEPHEPAALMDDSLRMNSGALARHQVRVVTEFEAVPPVLAEKSKALQILVNLIRNAKYALDEGGSTDKVITLRIESREPGRVRMSVGDNGVGIPKENLTRIFAHGFTTRAKGHGFGLHSSVLAAKEMNGSLTVHSDGPGTGAIFILELPAAATSTAPAESASS
jgi:PAS domain S-box-containing protein